MTQIGSLSAAFLGGGIATYHKEPCWARREPFEPQVYCVWRRKFESVARNELVHCHDAATMFLLPAGPVSSNVQHHEGEERFPGSILC